MIEYILLTEDGFPILQEQDPPADILLEVQPTPPVIVYTPMRSYTAPIPNGAYYDVPAEYQSIYTYLLRWANYGWAYQQQGQGSSSGPIAPTIPPP